MYRKWLVKRTNAEYIGYLSKVSSISPIIVQILINRGLKTPQEILDFLNPGTSSLADPFKLTGLGVAVERIRDALKRNERVLVHGDYDADGLSATAILLHTLKRLGLDVHYFIPNRITHGYGFGIAGVERAKELGARLIITVDCGITSFAAATISKKEGIDVIITDHHEPQIAESSKVNVQSSESEQNETHDFVFPNALCIVNPKLSTHNSQLSTLSGAGVAFKLAQALSMIHNSLFTVHDLLDLATIGTMADVVPLIGENRVIVKEGLKMIENNARPGVKALIEASGIDKRVIKSHVLPFTIIPRINASGRISDSHNVVRLLLTDSKDEAVGIASWLDKLNSERQRIEEEMYQEALSKINDKGICSAIVQSSVGWHPGVIGIVASRIAETFYRPTFVISIEGSSAKGSARSIPTFDIYKGLTDCREFLTGYGGHKQAVGFQLRSKNIPYFEERITKIANEKLSEEDLKPSLEIDANVNLSHISFGLIRELEALEPFGFGNPEPLLGSKGLEVLYPRVVGNNHLKMKLRQRSCSIDAIGFDMGKFFERLETSTIIDAVYIPLINEWERGKYLQLNVKAFRPAL